MDHPLVLLLAADMVLPLQQPGTALLQDMVHHSTVVDLADFLLPIMEPRPLALTLSMLTVLTTNPSCNFTFRAGYGTGLPLWT
jgi:hypothetical protein